MDENKQKEREKEKMGKGQQDPTMLFEELKECRKRGKKKEGV